uniref:EF-hand domain-containing protein n=1 Tax=Erythrolobus australicus TaxID=1077150 RepID=A0A7S1XIP7_9RHOD
MIAESVRKKRPKAGLTLDSSIDSHNAARALEEDMSQLSVSHESHAPRGTGSGGSGAGTAQFSNNAVAAGSLFALAPLMSPRVASKDAGRRKVRLRGSDVCPAAKAKLDGLLFAWMLRPDTMAFIEALVGQEIGARLAKPAPLVRQRSIESPTFGRLGGAATSNSPPPSSSAANAHQHAVPSFYAPGSHLSNFINSVVSLGQQSPTPPLSPRRVTQVLDAFSLEPAADVSGHEEMDRVGSDRSINRNISRTMSSTNSLTRRKYPRTLSTMGTSRKPVSQRKAPGEQAVPRFYYPLGEGDSEQELMELELLCDFFNLPQMREADDDFAEEGAEIVEEVPRNSVTRPDFAEVVVEVFGLPSFYSSVLFDRIYYESKAKKGEAAEQNGTAVIEDDSVSAIKANGSERGSERHAAPNDEAHENAKASDDAMVDAEVMSDTAEQVLSRESVFAYYEKECKGRSRPARLFYSLCFGTERNYLTTHEVYELVESLLVCHPGLSFLQATPEFQQRYAETVVERIFFSIALTASGRIYLKDVIESEFLDTLMEVDEDEDINRERKFFSYEHFYVLYCRFWELDSDHDLLIDREDLLRYNGHSLTCRIVDRVFEGCGRPLDCKEPGFMGYTDFVWFCLCEEDKTHRSSIDYWFRCVDVDGDGVLSLHEMEYFYAEQLHRMECLGHEAVKLVDILCQLLDMVKPHFARPVITRKDLRRSGVAGNVYNVLFNLNKFFSMESRDPLQLQQERATPHLTDWDRFAQSEYMRLSEEEEEEDDDEEDGVDDNGEDWEEVEEHELLSDPPHSADDSNASPSS